jgi:hypothetical protein
VAKPDRRENRDVPGSDQSLKSLMDEYLDSTREPIGSRNLFQEAPDQSEKAGARAGRRDEAASAEPSAIILYFICVAVLLIAALAIGFL